MESLNIFEKNFILIGENKVKQSTKIIFAKLDSQVKVFYFDRTELPSKHIQWVKYSPLITKEILGTKT